MSSNSEAFLASAAALAHEVADSAIWFEGRCTWMGSEPGDDSRPLGGQRTYAALGADLYNGTSGVALFLADAAVRLDDDRLRATALGAIRHALDHADRIAPKVRDGLYAGQIGIAYAAARVARSIASEVPQEGACEVLRAWRRSLGRASNMDVFDGRAGAVTGLVALSELIDEPWFVPMATELAEDLIASASRSPAGWSWADAADSANHHLCGFSHGTAGIGHALFELFGATRDSRFREAGEQAFGYEQSWFERRAATWPDLRGVARKAGWDAPAPAMGSWCHGAPGIALSRLRAEQLVSPVADRMDADAALAVTRRLAGCLLSRFPEDFSLCHGAAGIGDVLLYAADTGRGGIREIERLAADIGLLGMQRRQATGDGFPSGLPDGQTPGLFLGLAGIGLFYLRLADRGVTSPLIIHPGARLDSAKAPSIESDRPPQAR